GEGVGGGGVRGPSNHSARRFLCRRGAKKGHPKKKSQKLAGGKPPLVFWGGKGARPPALTPLRFFSKGRAIRRVHYQKLTADFQNDLAASASPAERFEILLASARHAAIVITAPPQAQSDSPERQVP